MATQKDMMLKLAESGLDKDDVKSLGIKFLSKAGTKKLVKKELAAFQLPYHELNGKKNCFWRLRFLEYDKVAFGGKKKRPQRYTQPHNAAPRLYFPTNLEQMSWAAIAKDPAIDLILTEGELKSACACKFGFPTIGLGGVYSWKSKAKNQPLIPDMKAINWKDRIVYLVFDSDLATNDMVQAALSELSFVLTNLGAHIHIAYLPDVDGLEGKTGLDDFLVNMGGEAFEALLEDADIYNLSQELWNLNREVIYIKDPGLLIRRDSSQKISPGDFTAHAFSNRFFYEHDGDKLKRKKAARAWLDWSQRFELNRITYKPGQEKITDESEYNEWHGWGVEPKQGDVSPWRDLLNHIFKGEKESREWFEKWCAFQFQNPGVKQNTAVVFWSTINGTGKSLIGYTLGAIFGKNFIEISQEDLHDNYNAWSQNKQFVMGDEITGTDKKQDANKLKKLITQKEINVNVKYIPHYTIPDCINYYFTSNSPNALYLDGTDRRFFVWELFDKMESDFYVKTYDSWLHSNGPSHLFDHFLNMDLGDFDHKTAAPVTDAKLEMIHDARGDLSNWALLLKSDPDSLMRMGGKPIKSDLMTPVQLMSLFDSDGQFNNVTAFGRALKNAGLRKLKVVKIEGKAVSLYAVRDAARWSRARPKEIASYYQQQFPAIDSKAKRKKY